ncbi:MAG: class II fumarate hydratase [Spirochaetaceae bacterium]
MEGKTRREHDSMGSVEVPEDAYWGASTQRAAENFAVSPYRIPQALIRALALIKLSAAKAHLDAGNLETEQGEAVIRAAEEALEGKFDDQFPVDVFQTGSGTSWNMNINEVLARRAGELLGKKETSGGKIHPNDVVNKGQSSNDVIPTAINIACRLEGKRLLSEMTSLQRAFERKEREFSGVIKLGRTHLQDAVPITLGQEISGWREQVRRVTHRLEPALDECRYVPLGGTALGTGLNSSTAFAKRAVWEISRRTGISFGGGHSFAGIAARDESLAVMGALNETAVVYMKIAQDLRLLSSGPRGGFGEIRLKALQPGSSIMPGKVNPVIPEMVLQAAAFVMGKHTSLTVASQNAPLQLNIMQPLIAHELLVSIDLLARVTRGFRTEAVESMEADEERCLKWVHESLALVTPLARHIGYDRAAQIAHRAYSENRALFDVALEEKVMGREELEGVLDPRTMVGPF